VLRIRLWSLTLRASWWMAALTLFGVVLFAQLGRWQWHRAELKRANAAAFVAGTAEVTPLGSRATTALARYAQVRVSGRYNGEHQFLLDNITHGGAPGYAVLTPLRLADGRTLLVDRGWVPLPQGRRDRLPDVALKLGAAAVEITGRLDALPVAGLASGTVPPDTGPNWPKRTSFPTYQQLGLALGSAKALGLEQRQLLLSADAPDGYVRDWQPVSSGFGPERHISYAVQWWGLGALSLFLFLFLNVERRRT